MTPLSTRPSIGGDALRVRRRRGGVKHTYRDAVLDDHPVVFWPLSDPVGALVARDLSGNGYDGAVATGHQTLVFGEPGYTSDGATALRQASPFDVGDSVAVGSTVSALAAGTGPWTLEVAVGTYDTGDDAAMLALGVPDDAQHGWVLYFFSGALWLNDDSGNVLRWACGIDPSATMMHHYAASYDGSGGFAAYVDAGPLVLAQTFGAPLPNVVSPGLAVGNAYGGLWSGKETVADAAFYNYALSPAQIAAHVAAR